MFAHTAERRGGINGSPDAVFAFLDDPQHLAAHMERRSWRMLGSRFTLTLDALAGREAPHRRRWQTTGAPRMLLIGAYEQGFALHPASGGSTLAVDIRYDLSAARLPLRLRAALASYYAR